MLDSESVFLTECSELLEEFEQALLELENDVNNQERVNQAFRAMHTLKGSGGMFGYDTLCNLAHHVEDLLDAVRNQELILTEAIISLCLQAKDKLVQLVDEDKTMQSDEVDQLIDVISDMLDSSEAEKTAPNTVSDDTASCGAENRELSDISTGERFFRIRIRPNPETLTNGLDPMPILRELSLMGQCQITCFTDNLPDIETYQAEQIYLSWRLVLSTEEPVGTIEDVFLFVMDSWDVTIQDVTDEFLSKDEGDYQPIGKILSSAGDVSEEQVQQVLKKQSRTGELLVSEGLVSKDQVRHALKEQQQQKLTKEKSRQQVSSIKVDAEKIDALLDKVSELVINQARLTEISKSIVSPALESVVEDFERLVDDLRDSTLTLRMLPFGHIFSRFQRLVRDTSKELNKKIKFHTVGEDTEIDKNVIDKISEPLIHLIRNSMDHGLEGPKERASANKDETGQITLSAYHEDSNVIISIEDDGRGIDPEKIRQKAIEKGVIPAGSFLDKKQALNLIFEPGFSTAQQITNLSGRGVGMDAVKRSIEDLNGSVEIDSTVGKGTHVKIQLPMSLAIIEGMLVRISGEVYAIPLDSIVECIEFPADKIKQSHTGLINRPGGVVPYLNLKEYFGIAEYKNDFYQVIVTRNKHSKIGYLIDEVIGQQQVVIKSLGEFYHETEAISGATILGDGNVALILDINKLGSILEQEKEVANL